MSYSEKSSFIERMMSAVADIIRRVGSVMGLTLEIVPDGHHMMVVRNGGQFIGRYWVDNDDHLSLRWSGGVCNRCRAVVDILPIRESDCCGHSFGVFCPYCHKGVRTDRGSYRFARTWSEYEFPILPDKVKV